MVVGLTRAGRVALVGGTALAVLSAPAWAAAQTSDVEVVSDIRYATHGGVDLLLDAYLPPGRGPFPAVIVIPGGRWVDIDKTKHADVPTYFAEHRIAAFSIEYRSALDFPYPAAIEDVTSAIRWVRRHADDYGVDPDRLGAVGVSAGGHLAALAAARGTGPLDRGARVAVVASWSGPMDLRPLVDSDDVERIREPVRTFLGCSDEEPCADVAAEASPITYVDETDPPMVLVHGSDDFIPVDQAESMAAALEDAGVDHHLLIAQGGHGAGYGGGNKVLDQVIPFVRAWIRGRPAPTDAPSADQGGGAAGTQDDKGAASPASPAAPPDSPKPVGGSGEVRSRPGIRPASSAEVLMVAAVMIGLLVVMGQVFVIVSLRRRGASVLRPDDGAGPEAGMGGM
jgi:acetyl esterase/lipase